MSINKLTLIFTIVLIAASCCILHIRADEKETKENKFKRIAILGDSMTWIGGDSCQNERGWTHTFRQLYQPVAIDIYARSGATWTDSPRTVGDTTVYSEILADENVVSNQMRRLIGRSRRNETTVPDLIIIYAGANDAWFSTRRPGIFDPASQTSLDSCVRSVCRQLKVEFPASKILLISPIEMTKVPVEKITKVSDIIERSGRSLGIATLRADQEVDIRRRTELIKPTLTTDGVHTNPAGARILGEYIIKRISEL